VNPGGAPALRRFAIVAKVGSRDAANTAQELAEWLRRRGREAVLDQATLRAKGMNGEEAFHPGGSYDLVVVLGGDGTLLSVARTLTSEVPLLGVNLGNLGFLTEIHRGELYSAMVRVLEGSFKIERRTLFDVAVERASGGAPGQFLVLNDAVITKSALARIIDLTLRVGDHLIARFRADGLIVSTPTGSTAYNLSAGGPILYPLLPVAVLTPICPHALALRPIVVPDDVPIEVRLETQREEVFLTLDGQEGTSLGFGDVVRVTRSAARVRLARVSARSFYDNLRGKLRWGGLTEEAAGGVDPSRGGPAE
jgi:NAD+ kinase